MKNNSEIRQAAKHYGVRHWEIAAFLGVSEATIMRWLRSPIAQEKESKILAAIEQIALERKGEI